MEIKGRRTSGIAEGLDRGTFMQMDNAASEAQAPVSAAGAYKALEAKPELRSCRKADCVALTTDHSTFDEAAIAKESRLIVDTRSAFYEFRRAKTIPL